RNLDRVDVFEIAFGEVLHLVEKHATSVERDAAFHGFANGARLLVNLFEHEMFEAALFRLDGIPGNALPFRLDLVALEICDADGVPGHDGYFIVAEKKHVARVLENCGYVRRNKKFSVADADDHGWTKPRRNDGVRFVRADY